MNARREIVCLCGSTRFAAEFRRARLHLTLQGRIVLTIGCDAGSDELIVESGAMVRAEGGWSWTAETKARLDALHLCKIDLANRIHVLNVGGYVGESTKREIAYAVANGKAVTWFNPIAGERFMESASHELGKLAASFLAAPTAEPSP